MIECSAKSFTQAESRCLCFCIYLQSCFEKIFANSPEQKYLTLYIVVVVLVSEQKLIGNDSVNNCSKNKLFSG